MVRKTVLNETHRALGAKMVPFAGWEMPVSYPAGIFAEHRATRTAAGLFDVSHMSVFDFQGERVTEFLETLLAGRVEGLAIGRAAYNYLLNPSGTAFDDTYLYRLAEDRYLLVVNAANAQADWDWITSVNDGRVLIDPADPSRRLGYSVRVRDLRDAGADSLLDIAFQGPRSTEVLLKLGDAASRARLGSMKRNDVAWVSLAGLRVLASRTGYTGEPLAYELFVHPDVTLDLWSALLDAGHDMGVLATGLGARDAARLEAGLPLFGHELEGEFGGTIHENGYTWVPKLDGPWFIGKSGYAERVRESRRKVVRLAGSGAKSVRGGHRVLGDADHAVGTISSFAYLDDAKNFIVLAFVDDRFADSPGRVVRAARTKDDPTPGDDLTDKIVELRVLPRFPDKAEREEWRRRYR